MRKKEDTIMAYVITDECVAADPVLLRCPSEAISEGADHFEIDAGRLRWLRNMCRCLSYRGYPARRIIQRTTYRKRRAAAKLRLFFIFIYSYVFSGFFLIFYPLKRQRLRVWQAAVFWLQDQENDIFSSSSFWDCISCVISLSRICLEFQDF